MSRRKTNPDFLTGIPELLVLRIISRQPMHGYAVVQAIKLHSDGGLKFGEGSIYPVLHRLETDGVLQTERVMANGRERVVYSITADGQKRLSQSHASWQKIVTAVEAVFDGGKDENQTVA